MKFLDDLFERRSRQLAQHSSRRGVLKQLGGLLVGGAAIPLLPVARAEAAPKMPQEVGDETDCDYWRYCAIDGFLCSCCGGSKNSCPPGTEMSPITWIGTCENPADKKHYIITYNDCCGKFACKRCFCNRNEREEPEYRPQKNNEIHWCLGTKSTAYTCSVAAIVGTALKQDDAGGS